VTCHEWRSLEAYNVRRRASDGRQPRCRDCCKAWYVANRVPHQIRVAARRRRVRAEYRALLGAYLVAHPCVVCGENDLRVLDFDHRPGSDKIESVAVMVMTQMPWHRVLAEIDKCDVRCANCHRRITAERGNHWRHRFMLGLSAENNGEAATNGS
jgi:hypothetical protein